ncbi:hypothetical protein GUJ93_ZPchr0010g8212 [Zizania palustris]|uniref:Uncharacterized protein n=1 Tax=Zizania palustris TaxID=103762 RepID=A0A8J5WAE7_ZIZPA|nr:hypothetical protein GUJ93_ZPchr0010g8212 [Zizania palustris]
MLAVARRRLLLFPVPLRFFSVASTTAEQTVSYLVSTCGLSPAEAARAAASVRVASPGSTGNADAVLALFRRYGFTEADITNTVRMFPIVLASDPDKTLQPKLDFLASVGVTTPLFGRLVSISPIILHRRIEAHLVPLFDSLREILGSDSNIVTVLRKIPFILRYPHKDILLSVATLRDVHGISPSELSKLIALKPGVVLQCPDRINEIVQVIENVGVEPGNPMFVYMFAILSRMKAPTLENKFAVFRSFGFDKDDVNVMLRRYPGSMAVSEEKIKKTVAFLIGKAGLSREEIVRYPNTLALSLDSHCRRCAVFAVLRREGKPVAKHRLPSALHVSKAQFEEMYVLRHHQDVPDVSRAFRGEIPFEGF